MKARGNPAVEFEMLLIVRQYFGTGGWQKEKVFSFAVAQEKNSQKRKTANSTQRSSVGVSGD
jgi:hypothetical protein